MSGLTVTNARIGLGAGVRMAFAVALLASQIPVTPARAGEFQPVPELPYLAVEGFFRLPAGMNFGEAAGVALNSKGHVFVFHRSKPMLLEFDAGGKFLRSLGDGLFDHPHGLRIDAEDNIWTTDDVGHVVLKLDPNGRVLLVLGRRGEGAEADWLFNGPADVAFSRNGDVFVADGYGNSRIVKFDREGRFIKSWGSHGSRPGEFSLPHTIAIDDKDQVYVGDRENQRIQIFDADGNFLEQWTGIGYPYGLFITPDQHVWMADGGFGRIVELNRSGKIIGAFGEPGHAAGQFAWAHFLALDRDRQVYVADVLNWRFQVFEPTAPTGRMTSYVPGARKFWHSVPSSGWLARRPTQ